MQSPAKSRRATQEEFRTAASDHRAAERVLERTGAIHSTWRPIRRSLAFPIELTNTLLLFCESRGLPPSGYSSSESLQDHRAFNSAQAHESSARGREGIKRLLVQVQVDGRGLCEWTPAAQH